MASTVYRTPGGGTGHLIGLLILVIIVIIFHEMLGSLRFWLSIGAILVSPLLSLLIATLTRLVFFQRYKKEYGYVNAKYSYGSPKLNGDAEEKIIAIFKRTFLIGWIVITITSIIFIFIL